MRWAECEVGESSALVGSVFPVDRFVVGVAECGSWKSALTYGAESAVTGCGSMVGSAVGAGEFGSGGG